MKNLSIFLMVLFGSAQVSICMNLFSSKKQQLFKAIENDNLTTVEKLITKNPKLVNSKNDGDTSLHAAVEKKNESLVKLLLDKNANIEAQDDEDGWTPLHIAVFRGHESLVNLLLDKGANIDAHAKNGWTPLHGAVNKGSESMITMLLDRNANIEAQDMYGRTSLYLAVHVHHGNDSLVTLLLSKGVNIETPGNNGWTPLHRAVNKGSESLVTLLLDRNANIEVQDNMGKTPLRYAQEKGYQNIVNLLKQKQLSSSALNESTSTVARKNAPMFEDIIEISPLHQAVQENNYSKIQELIAQGGDINRQTRSGVTALMIACIFGYIDIVRFLLDRGADKDLKDAKGKTAFDCARNNNQQAVMKLLRERAQYASTASKSSNVFVYGQITSQGASSSTPQYADLKLLPANRPNNDE